MRVLVVDDEQLARDRLRRMLDDSDAECVGEAVNGIDAIEQVNKLLPDLVLLDIRMPGMDGLEAASHIAELEEPPAVIFCTAYEEHAIEAFDVSAVGYLLKPVRRDDLKQALTKAGRVNKAQLQTLTPESEAVRTHICARTRRGIELVPINDVRYFQADQKYVTVRHGEGELIIDDTLRELEDEFGERFVRIHRNSLVSVRHIAGLERDDDGHFSVRLADVDELLVISRRHVAGVRKLVKQL
ncbi:MAG: LytTR family DNA-binding domain-containing protein [Pseudomonadaceae bacterium]|nr:LytTR family DNA-binding domain-containing protein [Pseudomonadaceae bacterium]